MPQIAPFLDPSEGRRGTARPANTGGDSLPEPGARDGLRLPIIPVTGFLRRFAAMIFDFLLIYFAFRLLTSAAPDVFLSMGRHSSKLAAGLVFAYFALGNGPVGRGRTVGKLLVGLRTTTLDGKVPGIGTSALRTLLLFPILPIQYFVLPLVLDENRYVMNILGSLVTGFFMVALFAATVLAIVFNPFKQGMHDWVARTLVRPSAAPQLTFDELCSMVGENWRRYHRQPQLFGVVSLLLFWSFFIVSMWPWRASEGTRDRFEIERAIAQTPALDGSMIASVSIRPADGDDSDAVVQDRFIAAVADKDSTMPLALRVELLRASKWNAEDPATRAEAEELARRYYREILARYPLQDVFPRMPIMIENFENRPLVLEVRLIQSIPMLFPYESKDMGTVRVPMPPLGTNKSVRTSSTPPTAS